MAMVRRICEKCGREYYVDVNDTTNLCHECYQDLYSTDITKQQIKIIHIILSNWNIEDSEYRSILNDEFGVKSCKDLTKKQAEELIHKLNYDNDSSYRYGYNKALATYLDKIDFVEVFKTKFQPSKLELQMFEMMNYEQQKKILGF